MPIRFCRSAVLILAAALTNVSLHAQQPLFTEDFESGTIDRTIWDIRTEGVATLFIQQEQAAHGKYALQVHYPQAAEPSFAFIVSAHLPDSVHTHLFGRAYVKIAASIPSGHTVLTLAGAVALPASKFQEIAMQDGVILHAETPPFDKWFLLEWEFNDNPATLTIWIDGRLMQTMQGEHIGGFEEAGFGARVWGAVPQAFDVFYDDIAIGTTRIGPLSPPAQ